jgi:hypothetical protein
MGSDFSVAWQKLKPRFLTGLNVRFSPRSQSVTSSTMGPNQNLILRAGECNWIQTRQSLKIEYFIFSDAHRSNISAEYNAWRNCLDR